MNGIKAGVTVMTKFCTNESALFEDYINYMNREEAVRNNNSMKYNLYQDYMGNPDKTTGIFTKEQDELSREEKKQLASVFKTAQENGSLMWQTVISFDNRWLENNGLYQGDHHLLDEDKIKATTRSAIQKMLDSENLQNGVWTAAIHYNTDNIHVHIATVEPFPMREKKEYIQYEEKDINGKKTKIPLRDKKGKVLKKEEYKGRFKQKSIEACKSEVVNQILNERENNLKINTIIRDSIIKEKKEHFLAKDKDLYDMFSNLHAKMPKVNRNLWNYNNPIMNPLKDDINQLSLAYIEKYHPEKFNELNLLIYQQAAKYNEAYGGERNYADGKLNDLYTRLGNTILKEIRDYDKKIKENHIGKDHTDENKTIEKKELDSEKKYFQDDFVIEEDFVDVDDDKLNMNWGSEYKKAKNLIFRKNPDYKSAIKILKEEHLKGNIIASFELGDIYRYGRGTKINLNLANQYYALALKGFEKFASENSNFSNYLNYKIGKMYYYGLGTEIDYKKSLSMFQAAENNIYAKYMMANMIAQGQGTKKDNNRAFTIYSSISHSFAYASYKAGSMIEQKLIKEDEEKMNSLYEQAFNLFSDMEQKNPDSNLEYRLGCMYFTGKGIDKDEEKALNLFEKAGTNGNIYAKEKLAKIYLNRGRYDLLPDLIETLKESSLKTNNKWAMYTLGNIFSDENTPFYDIDESMKWYEKAEGRGDKFISYKIGKMYLDENSKFYNLEKGIEFMERAAALGNSLANYQLGKIYSMKDNPLFDIDKAIKNYEIAAKEKNKLAHYKLAKIYYSDVLSHQDLNKAAYHFSKSGDSFSHYYLGKIYTNPQSELYNPEKGIRYFQRSASENNSFASLELGLIYLKGEVVDRDMEQARQWFTKSAEQGNAIAKDILTNIDANAEVLKIREKRKGTGYLLSTAINKLKNALRKDLEKSRADKEHDMLVENIISEEME